MEVLEGGAKRINKLPSLLSDLKVSARTAREDLDF